MSSLDDQLFLPPAAAPLVVGVPACQRQQVRGWSRYYEPDTGVIEENVGLDWDRCATAGGVLPERWFEFPAGVAVQAAITGVDELEPFDLWQDATLEQVAATESIYEGPFSVNLRPDGVAILSGGGVPILEVLLDPDVWSHLSEADVLREKLRFAARVVALL